jgi:UDP-glucose 4-epimerase/UDP-arabinose 4-epimerase
MTDHQGAVLVTGGAGYIGSHTAKALAEGGWRPVVFDDLSSGHREAVCWGDLVQGDVRDTAALAAAMRAHAVMGVIHFAGLIEVGRSVARPDLFYDHNVGGTAAVLAAMRQCDVGRVVFSSSAAVYGSVAGAGAPIAESTPKAPSSPYGETKLVGEWMIAAHCRAFGARGLALRYFNAAGADPSATIGEAHDPETHLIPLAIEAALGAGPPLTVFGLDFDTPDGACLRDYIHVSDLARAHVAALTAPTPAGTFEAMNVGTGQGRSVLEVIAAVDAAVGQPTPYAVGDRRPGDPASLVADPRLIHTRLGWRAQESGIDDIVETALRWRRSAGYARRRRCDGMRSAG